MAVMKVGLIGCGMIAKCNHIPEMLTLGKKAQIVAMFDTVKGKAKKLAEEQKLDPMPVICKSEKELLAMDLDAVIIATPNSFHYPQTIAALKAGKHVLVEKPMSTTTAEADEMIALAEKKGLILQVNQSWHYMAPYVMLQDLIANKGLIGKPLHARCLRCTHASPEIAWSPGADWFVQKKYHGSLIGDIAVHMADILQWMYGPAKTVQAQNTELKHEVVDNTIALFRYENGATGTVELSWTFPHGAGAMEFYGEKASVCVNAESNGFIVRENGKKDKLIPFTKAKKVDNSHQAFYKAVKSGKNDIRAWEIGRRAIAICCAMNEAGETGGSVTPDYGAAAAKKKTTVKKAASAAKKKTTVKKAASAAKKITTVKKAAPAAKKEGKKK